MKNNIRMNIYKKFPNKIFPNIVLTTNNSFPYFKIIIILILLIISIIIFNIV